MTSLEQVTQEIMDRYQVRASIDDRRPQEYKATFAVEKLNIEYRRFLATDGVPENIAALITSADEAKQREYFLHGPYTEYLTITAPSGVEFTAVNFVGEGEEMYYRSIGMTLPSLKADKHMALLRQSTNLLTKEFCKEWDAREPKSTPEERLSHIVTTDYPFAFYYFRDFVADIVKISE